MSDDTEDVEFGVNKLSNLVETFQEIEDPEIRFRFQKWLFPAGLTFDGEKFRTTKIPAILQIKRTALAGNSCQNFTTGEPTHINLELLFNDLFSLRDQFKELGMTIKDGEVYLADLENKDV